MDSALLVARILLAVVFAVAGLTKLADRAGSQRALGGFGVPAALAAPLGVLLPLAELAVAVALIPVAWAWWGALGALALLLLFVAGIGAALARGRRPDCHCFGQLHSAPAGWSTLARNAALAGVAAFIVWQGRDDAGRSAVAWLGGLTGVQWVGVMGAALALGALATLTWLVIQLLLQNGRLLTRVEVLEARLGLAPDGSTPAGLPVGTPAPTFGLPDLHGETVTLDALRAVGKPVLLLFSDPGCGPCNALMPEIGRWQREHAARMTIALISRGGPDANWAKGAKQGPTHILLQDNDEVEEAYRTEGTPSAVLVRPDGTIGSPLAFGAEEIRAQVARVATGAPPAMPTVGSVPLAAPHTNGNARCPHCGELRRDRAAAPAEPPAARVGQPAAALRLSDLDGNTVGRADFRGSSTQVLFWNPGCASYGRMRRSGARWPSAPRRSGRW